MSQKRKIEEFHDPDYPGHSLPNKKINVGLSPEERLTKIRAVIRREFQKELSAKEQEVMKIDSSISMTRKLLHRIRYAVVANYYNIKAAEVADSEQKSQNTVESEETSKVAQEPIHPALKSIIGKKPVNYDEILKSRPTREAFKIAKTTISEKLRAKKDEKRLQRQELLKGNEVVIDETAIKVPRYVDPNKEEQKIPQINMARGRHQTKHLIVVGNTSKFIGNEAINTNITHKWLVYVTTKTSVPTERLLTKVKFLLHPSYKPNDIIDVCAPPFQLSRRGWGEFPIRVQLFFNPKLQQKPVQLVHNLVLDKTLSGLQTMGAETLVEMWLNSEPLGESSAENLDNALSETVTESVESEERTQNNLPETTQSSDEFLMENQIKQEPVEDDPTLPVSNTLNQNFVENGIPCNDHNITLRQDKKLENLNSSPISNLVNQPENQSENTFQKKIFKCIGKDGKVKFVEIFVRQANGALNNSIKLNQPIDTDKKPISNLIPNKPEINGIQNQPPKQIILKSNSVVGTNNLQSKLIVPITNLARHDSAESEGKIRITEGEDNTCTSSKDTEKRNSETPSKNQVVLKNGKMYIIDPAQAKLKKQIKKQQSLLKPQISLLKPIVKNDNFQNCMRNYSNNIFNHTSVATDHDYTNLTGKASMPNTIKYHRPLSIAPQNSNLNNSSRLSLNKEHKSIVTVNGPSNKPINIILTKMEPGTQASTINQKPIALMKRARIDYRKQFEEEFFNRKFLSIRHAVEYLFRKLPLINPLASSSDYQTSFPFVVSDEKALSELALPKRRSYEWILARYISSVVKKYFSAIEIRKWTTKEIVIFGRYHGYTPVMMYSKESDEQPDKSSEGTNLKEIIKKEITKEKYFGQTLSLNHPIYKWINDAKQKISTDFSSTDEVIDVDSVDNEDTKPSNMKSYDTQMKSCEGKRWLPVNSEFENEVKLVNECSQQIGIRFAPEEIEPGVMHSSAQVVLASALRSFLDEILRRSLYLNIESQDFRNQKQLDLRPENVREAISNRTEFEFLTNKHLGIAKLKEQLD